MSCIPTPDVCFKCGSKDLIPRKTRKSGKICHPCNRAKKAAYEAANPRYSTNKARFYGTGCTPEMYDQMLVEQGHSCRLCKTPQAELKTALHADHCHTTGKLRQLLCGSCNRALGLLKDSPERLREAADYIEEWRRIHSTS